ncbi:BMP family protein [Mesorhizobium sp. SP-1A]|uniref:BMP family protein n=1 Tax=Mesorhizobium sp. SP-1A TaxID=3077840 RepID=UPI0028F74D85|nr:BMP family protein [Mesorhizobium sp. SP-1A]
MKPMSLACSLLALAALSAGPAHSAEKTKVALVLPAEINDLSWNQRAYEAAKKLSDEGKIEFAYSEAVKPDATTLDPIVAGYAQQGYQLIVTHSFTFGKTVARMAGQFKDVNFAWPGGIGKTADNLADYDQPFYQGYYLAGVLAGGMTESGVIGAVTGFDIPVCHASMVAFEAGAKSVRPDVKVLSTVTGNFVDVAKAKQAALTLADQGADYFMSCGQGVTLGTIEAAKERNLGATSYVGDMSSLAPKNVFASVVWNLDVLFDKMVTDIKSNTFRPAKFYSLGVPEGGISVTVHPEFHKKPSAKTMAAYDKALADIKSGNLKVAFVPK